MPIEIPEIEIKLEKVSDDEREEEASGGISCDESEESADEGSERKRKRINRELDTNRAIPTGAFKRMVKEMAMELTKNKDIRWESKAIDALHEDAEMYLTETFHRANQAKKMCKQVTLGVNHMHYAMR